MCNLSHNIQLFPAQNFHPTRQFSPPILFSLAVNDDGGSDGGVFSSSSSSSSFKTNTNVTCTCAFVHTRVSQKRRRCRRRRHPILNPLLLILLENSPYIIPLKTSLPLLPSSSPFNAAISL